MRNLIRLIVSTILFAALAGCATTAAQNIWRVNQVASIGGSVAEVAGAPRPANVDGHQALCFDGKGDGLFFNASPIQGWPQFTIQILLRPDGDGPEEQRLFHIQDEQEHRVLIETRVNPNHTWSLDTFLRNTDTTKLTLLDRAKVQPTDAWYWVALTYDGKTMRHFVNGAMQLGGPVDFVPMVPARTSLGVRLNRIHWFKGCISQLQFDAKALESRALRQP